MDSQQQYPIETLEEVLEQYVKSAPKGLQRVFRVIARNPGSTQSEVSMRAAITKSGALNWGRILEVGKIVRIDETVVSYRSKLYYLTPLGMDIARRCGVFIERRFEVGERITQVREGVFLGVGLGWAMVSSSFLLGVRGL